MSRPICKFFAQGYCRNGADCKFEHPGVSQTQNTNRFGALSNAPQQLGFGRPKSNELPYYLDRESIRKDLTEERPTWILSAYGPGRDAPEQLFGGYPREQSFEELRLHHQQAVAAGNPQSAINELNGLYQTAEQQIRHTLGNLDAALQFVLDGEKKHPNRIDICKQGSPPTGTTGAFSSAGGPSTSAFGGQTGAFAAAGQSLKPFGGQNTGLLGATTPTPATSAGAFGQPAALGPKPSPFGAPAFGQPSQPTGTSSFGQPSRLGTGFSAFGQASQLGAKPSPFGAAPPSLSPAPAFGQPSQPTSAFGQPSQAAAASPFGQPTQNTGSAASAFGQQSAFGQSSQPAAGAASSGFGQPSTLGAKPNPFGAPSATAASSPSPFATAAGNAQTGASQNPFGQKAQSASPFGQPSGSAGFNQQPAASPFGQPSSQQQPSANPFGAQTTPVAAPAASNPFGAPSSSAAALGITNGAGASNPFGAGTSSTAPTAANLAPAVPGNPTNNDPYPPDASRKHPPLESYSGHAPNGALQMWHGQTVIWQQPRASPAPIPMVSGRGPGQGSTYARIWFPDGPPPFTPETELPDAQYDDAARTAWAAFVDTGRFAGGAMPVLPPKREWCRWDF